MDYNDYENLAYKISSVVDIDWNFNHEGVWAKISEDRVNEIVNVLQENYIVDHWEDDNGYIILVTGKKLKINQKLKLRKSGNSYVLGYISPKIAEQLMEYGSQFNVIIEQL